VSVLAGQLENGYELAKAIRWCRHQGDAHACQRTDEKYRRPTNCRRGVELRGDASIPRHAGPVRSRHFHRYRTAHGASAPSWFA